MWVCPYTTASASGKRAAKRVSRPARRPGHVQHPDLHLLDLDHAAFGQKPPQLRLVGVAVNREQRRPERLQLLERRDARDVSGVEDDVRRAQELDAAIRQPARATRQVRVGNNGDACQPTPFKKRPSR